MNRKDPENNIAGIILAAGFSGRMGAFKPLLPLGKTSILEYQIDTMKQVPLDLITVVTGHRSSSLLPLLNNKGVEAVYNKNFSDGMFTSIQAGLKVIAEKQKNCKPAGCFLSLVDCPLVPPAIYREILAKYDSGHQAFIVPRFHGKKGHPLFIPSVYYDEILSYEGAGGLKHITDKHSHNMIFLDVLEESVVLDMDTQDEYKEILKYYEERLYSPKKKMPDTFRKEGKRKLYLIRHGETQRHSGKVFIGQTDIPLSGTGREQAREIAAKLLKNPPSADVIYSSDLSRAFDTAAIIRDALKEVIPLRVKIEADFREISLGPWDGMLVRDVRERYPEQYKKRGESLLSYKTGNEGENFYDLQYRVMKKMNKILLETEGDIVLVAHKGVIRTLLCNFSGETLNQLEKFSVPKGSLTLIEI